MNNAQFRVLIVEDNPADVLFLRRALRDHSLNAHVAVAKDGDSAIEYLEHCSNDQCPDLVVIDINLPKRDGIEVLRKCRFTPSLAETKTMVLASSDDPLPRSLPSRTNRCECVHSEARGAPRLRRGRLSGSGANSSEA